MLSCLLANQFIRLIQATGSRYEFGMPVHNMHLVFAGAKFLFCMKIIMYKLTVYMYMYMHVHV